MKRLYDKDLWQNGTGKTDILVFQWSRVHLQVASASKVVVELDGIPILSGDAINETFETKGSGMITLNGAKKYGYFVHVQSVRGEEENDGQTLDTSIRQNEAPNLLRQLQARARREQQLRTMQEGDDFDLIDAHSIDDEEDDLFEEEMIEQLHAAVEEDRLGSQPDPGDTVSATETNDTVSGAGGTDDPPASGDT